VAAFGGRARSWSSIVTLDRQARWSRVIDLRRRSIWMAMGVFAVHAAAQRSRDAAHRFWLPLTRRRVGRAATPVPWRAVASESLGMTPRIKVGGARSGAL
jgi:hypothetical protein